MGGYKRLFELRINHAYFKNEDCSVLQIIPSEQTKEFFSKTDLLLSKISNGVSISYNSDFMYALLAYQDDDITLGFTIQSVDSFFENYTESGRFRDRSLYFSSSSVIEKDGVNQLTKEEYVSDQDSLVISDPIFQEVFNKIDFITPPIGIITIHLKDIVLGMKVDDDLPSKRYLLKFKSKATYWRYNIIKRNDFDYDELTIRDNDKEITFSGKKMVSLANGEFANQIISQQPILLQEYSDYHFNLLGIKGKQERLIIKKLFYPDVKQIVVEEDKSISDLYVYY